jgi:hypothetical protein
MKDWINVREKQNKNPLNRKVLRRKTNKNVLGRNRVIQFFLLYINFYRTVLKFFPRFESQQGRTGTDDSIKHVRENLRRCTEPLPSCSMDSSHIFRR